MPPNKSAGKDQVFATCSACGAAFQRRTDGETRKAKYCSSACFGKAHSKRNKCEACGEDYRKTHTHQRFCSRVCAVETVQAARARQPATRSGLQNKCSKVWRLRAPDLKIYAVKNLREFVRGNVDLFAPEDTEWKTGKSGSTWCRALTGLQSLSDRKTNEARGTWKGWTWHSQTERLKNGGDDLLERTVRRDTDLSNESPS